MCVRFNFFIFSLNFSLPQNTIGKIGTPLLIAKRTMPVCPLINFPSFVLVPSGETAKIFPDSNALNAFSNAVKSAVPRFIDIEPHVLKRYFSNGFSKVSSFTMLIIGRG